VFIADARRQPDWFHNLAWMEQNGIRSVASLPLSGKDRAIGVLTLYTGFVYHFPDRVRQALANIAQSLFARAARSELYREYLDYKEAASRRASELAIHHRLMALWSDQAHFLRMISEKLLTARNNLEAKHLLFDLIGATVLQIDDRVDVVNDAVAHKEPLCPVNLAALVDTVVHYHRLGLDRESITITPVVTTRRILWMRKGFLHTVLDNLISNAIQAVQDAIRQGRQQRGTVTLTLGETESTGSDYLEIAVHDDGVGIPPEHQEKLASPGFTTHGDGRGFGLYSVKNVAVQYAGDFYIVSTPGMGTTVSIRLNLKMFPERKNDHDN
jgi:signal transduction histidine kinase